MVLAYSTAYQIYEEGRLQVEVRDDICGAVWPVASALASCVFKWRCCLVVERGLRKTLSPCFRRASTPNVLIDPAICNAIQDDAQALPHSKPLRRLSRCCPADQRSVRW